MGFRGDTCADRTAHVIGVGSMVSGYRVQRVLGSGGMGTVYAVTDPQLPRLDALKVLPAELSSDTEFRARFQREADIAAGLDHPNIVSVYDRGETPDGRLWIALQLVDGTDADAALRAGTMTPARAVHITAAVAEALDYAHSRNVLHRDIKPANFLLSGPIDADERVLLGDFGIARAADDTGMTATNSIVATMAYAAPEVLDGRTVDYRADLYSLGCTLFHLLTGQPPYADARGMAAQAMAHLSRPVPRPSAVARGVSPAFDAVVATAMAKDPAARFSSGRELAAAATAALRDQHREQNLVDWRPHPAQQLQPSTGLMPGATGEQHNWPSPTMASGTASSTAPPWSTGPAPGSPPVHRRRAVMLAALAGGVVLVGSVVAAVTLGGSPEPPPPASPSLPEPTAPAAPVPDTDLPGLLLSAEQTSAVMGLDLQAQQTPITGFANDLVLNNPECVALVFPLQRDVYRDSGAQTGYAQIFNPADTAIKGSAAQAVTAYNSADLARSFIDRQAALWPACAYSTVKMAGLEGGPAVTWQLGPTKNTNGTLTTITTKMGGPTTCQRVLTAANNIVIDVMACLPTPVADQGATIAQQITKRVPQ